MNEYREMALQDSLIMDDDGDGTGEESIADSLACPSCGESRADFLPRDGELFVCASCGVAYRGDEEAA